MRRLFPPAAVQVRSLVAEALPLPLQPPRASGAAPRASTDLRQPHEAFPLARRLRRTVHAHLGPTNSGKTHAALRALKSARSGVYCGPLRLLTWEAHDELNAVGVPCSLRTGQERVETTGARHTACTVEMCSLHEAVEVGVLDEFQMAAHAERGWAWSRAFFGLQAEAVHLCGSADAAPLVRALAQACGDTLVEHSYERLAPLALQPASLGGDLGAVRPGDAVVAFSWRQIFELKREIEEETGLDCCVLYGSLPPEVAARKSLGTTLPS